MKCRPKGRHFLNFSPEILPALGFSVIIRKRREIYASTYTQNRESDAPHARYDLCRARLLAVGGQRRRGLPDPQLGFCVFGAQPDGTVYGWIFALVGICAFLVEFYGRIRHRRKQMPYPKGYSLCRYAGFACAAAAVFVQYHLRQMTASLLLLAAGLLLVEVSILMDKAERRRLRARRELEES